VEFFVSRTNKHHDRTVHRVMCFAGRVIALSEGTAASLLLRGHWHVLFRFEAAWKYAFSAIASLVYLIFGRTKTNVSSMPGYIAIIQRWQQRRCPSG
jgi:hypothetical protein